MPRAYRLGKRADQKHSTRARIVRAAIELYLEVGLSVTSMLQVARRADVAPATVSNHFPTRDDLDRAIVDRALAEMAAPELSIYDGLETIAERISRLSRETGAFLDRAVPWYRMLLREPMVTGVWAEAGAAYGTRWEALFRTALGPLADDPEAMAILRAMMHPNFFDALRLDGRSTIDVADLVSAAITPWLELRIREFADAARRGADT
jgi:AcrR family transcriptional regulator